VCLALGGLRRTPLRVALTAAGVAIATGALVSMVGFALGIQARVEEPFQKMELANRIDVTAPRRPAEDPPRIVLDKDALARIAGLPGVALAYPELRLAHTRVVYGEQSQDASAAGLPREAVRLRFVREALVGGRFFDPGDAPQAVLGTRLARDLGFAAPSDALGQSLTLEVKGLSPSGDRAFAFEERRLTVQVVGVWDPPEGRHGYTADGLLLPTELVEPLPGVQAESMLDRLLGGAGNPGAGYGHAVVRVERAGDLFAVEARIQQMGFRTQTLLGEVKDMRTAFLMLDTLLTAVGAVALVVAGLGTSTRC
jgi:hypothetical protein